MAERMGLEGPALGRVEVGRRASEFRPSVDGYPASQVFSHRLGGHKDHPPQIRRNKTSKLLSTFDCIGPYKGENQRVHARSSFHH